MNLNQKTNIPALYLHIPFCKTVCPFCSFAVMKDAPRYHHIYLELLKKEMVLLKERVLPDFQTNAIESVYFGGGTPSVLKHAEFSELITLLKREFGFNPDCQWSIEMNPEDVTPDKIQNLQNIGINRVSLGIQSFSDENLKKLGRHHTAAQSREAIQILKSEGVRDINLDIMYGFPGHDKTMLNKDLDDFLSYSPTHISPYCLNIEPKTVLNRKTDWIDWQDEHETLLYEMFLLVSEKLEQEGYLQYEVSNFSLDGFQSRQNRLNWDGKNYLGIGAGAHSYLYPKRWGNMKRYIDYKKMLSDNQLPRAFYESLTAEDELDEFIMIRLRLREGLDLKVAEERFGIAVEKCWEQRIDRMIREKLAVLKGSCLKLTSKGLFLTDEIAAELAAAI